MDDEVRKALRAVQMADQEIELFFALFWRAKDKILDIEMHRDAALQQLIHSAIQDQVLTTLDASIQHTMTLQDKLAMMVRQADLAHQPKRAHLLRA